jgi:hypothetical protein
MSFPLSSFDYSITQRQVELLLLSQPFKQVVSNSQRVGDDGQAGIHGCD